MQRLFLCTYGTQTLNILFSELLRLVGSIRILMVFISSLERGLLGGQHCVSRPLCYLMRQVKTRVLWNLTQWLRTNFIRSEEHTSELQSRGHLVCRLLLENKNTK